MQKKGILPTYLPYFFSYRNRKQTIYFSGLNTEGNADFLGTRSLVY